MNSAKGRLSSRLRRRFHDNNDMNSDGGNNNTEYS